MQSQRRQIWIKSNSVICRVSICKLHCHVGTAAIRQRMPMVVFLTAYCTHLLLQPHISHSLMGRRRHGGEGKRKISSPPLVIHGWIFCMRSFSKACFPSSEACSSFTAKKIRTYASWSSSGIKPVISTWPSEVGMQLAHFCGQGFVLVAVQPICLHCVSQIIQSNPIHLLIQNQCICYFLLTTIRIPPTFLFYTNKSEHRLSNCFWKCCSRAFRTTFSQKWLTNNVLLSSWMSVIHQIYISDYYYLEVALHANTSITCFVFTTTVWSHGTHLCYPNDGDKPLAQGSMSISFQIYQISLFGLSFSQ